MIKKYDELLESMGFEEKNFEKLNKYICNHVIHEKNENLSSKFKIETTLHLALMTLLKVDNFDDVIILDKPNISEAHNMVIKIFNKIHNNLPNNMVEDILNHSMIEQTASMINEKIRHCNLNIFILFNRKWIDEDGNFYIQHRYAEKGFNAGD